MVIKVGAICLSLYHPFPLDRKYSLIVRRRVDVIIGKSERKNAETSQLRSAVLLSLQSYGALFVFDKRRTRHADLTPPCLPAPKAIPPARPEGA